MNNKRDPRHERYMESLMDQTYRVATYGKRLTHGQMCESMHVVGLISCYRDLADLLERVLEEHGLDRTTPTLPGYLKEAINARSRD